MTKHIHHARHFDLLYDDAQRDGVIDEIVCGRADFFDGFLKPVYDQYVTPGVAVVEVGAHVGTHTLYLSKLVGAAGAVLAFEPQLPLFGQLCANLWLNDCRNVTPVRAALFSRPCMLAPNVAAEGYWDSPAKAGLSFSPTEQVTILTAAGYTLDSYGLARVDLIKIDAEQNDYQVALGALGTISRHLPVIAFEEDQRRTAQWQTLLGSIGYTITRLAESNYLAVPAGRLPFGT